MHHNHLSCSIYTVIIIVKRICLNMIGSRVQVLVHISVACILWRWRGVVNW